MRGGGREERMDWRENGLGNALKVGCSAGRAEGQRCRCRRYYYFYQLMILEEICTEPAIQSASLRSITFLISIVGSLP